MTRVWTISLMILWSIFSGPAWAQQVSSNAMDQDARVAAHADALLAARDSSGAGEPALWRLADHNTEIYIFGTVHLLKPGTDWRSKALDTAYKASDIIVLETDTSNAESMRNVQTLMVEHGRFTGSTTLFEALNERQTSDLRSASEQVGAPYRAFERVKPWLVSQHLTTRQMMKEGYSAEFGIETVLTAEGRTDGKAFLYLETPEDQLRALSAAPLDEQIEALAFRAATLDSFPTFIEQTIIEWLDGDIAGLRRLYANPDLQIGRAGYEALLTKRNRKWVPIIEALLDRDGTILVSVGFAHLVGDESVLELLKERGFEIERIQSGGLN